MFLTFLITKYTASIHLTRVCESLHGQYNAIDVTIMHYLHIRYMYIEKKRCTNAVRNENPK